MTTAHANCTHPATKTARAACRKARTEVDTQALALLALLDANPSSTDWALYAARRFADYQGNNRTAAAREVLNYFAPSGDEARDASRRANGYMITTDLHTIRRIIFRAAS